MKDFEFEDQIVHAFFDNKKLCFAIPSGWDGIKLMRFKETYKKEIREMKLVEKQLINPTIIPDNTEV
jgi:hypothetical protein